MILYLVTVCVDYIDMLMGKFIDVQMHASDNYTAMLVLLITEQHNTIEHVGSFI